ncbi:hypothetical protein [Azospirillum argentinense]
MLTDTMWRRLLTLLPPQKPMTRRPSLDHRRFLEAVLWLARTAAPWRDLPEDVMNWRTAWRRLQRWTAAEIWGRIVAELRAIAPNAGYDAHLFDSSVISAHAHAAGARHRSGEQALGRSRRLSDQDPPTRRPSRPAARLRAEPWPSRRPEHVDGADGSGRGSPGGRWAAAAKTRACGRRPRLLQPSDPHVPAPLRDRCRHPTAVLPKALRSGGLGRVPIPQRYRAPDQSHMLERRPTEMVPSLGQGNTTRSIAIPLPAMLWF